MKSVRRPFAVFRFLLVLLAPVAGFLASPGEAAGPVDAGSIVGYPESHPRLFADESTFADLQELVSESQRHGEFFAVVKARADGLMDVAPLRYKKIGRRLLSVSREALARVTALSITAKVTGEEAYLLRLTEELRAVCGFRDWNPSHFLDTAEMCLAVAIGYDWFHGDFAETDRELFANAIVELGLEASYLQDYWWVTTENNWNQVCHGGLSAGAIAVLDEEPELAKRVLTRAIENIHHAMDPYEPVGVYPEGPRYWAYGTSFNLAFFAMLDFAFGHTFGLLDGSAISKSPIYIEHVTGPTGEFFNYSDNSSSAVPGTGVVWLANHTGQPGMAMREEEKTQKFLTENPDRLGRMLPLRLLWMDANPPASEVELPLDFHGIGINPIGVHRTSWTNPNALYLAVKAGSPHVNHGHMDTGSFVLEADGVRWAIDLGAEGYHGIEARGMNLWASDQDSDRWTVFRLNNFSHNTLVIDGQLQVVRGDAPILEFSAKRGDQHTVIDMTPVYAGLATKVHRSVGIIDSSKFEIVDTLEGVESGKKVRWAMTTRADVSIEGDRVAVLEQNGRQLILQNNADGGAWEVFSMEPPNEWDSPNPGVRQVGFYFTSSGQPIEFNVSAVPGGTSRHGR